MRAGRIRHYGVSSNTCTKPAGDPEAISLARMLEAAREGAGAGHHFRVLQLPLNLYESGAVLEKSDGPDGSEHGPRDGAGRRRRRAREPAPQRDERSRPPAARVRHRPRPRLRPGDAARRPGRPGGGVPHDHRLPPRVARRLRPARRPVPVERRPRAGSRSRVEGLEQWGAIESQRILPRLAQALQALDRHLTGDLGRGVAPLARPLRARAPEGAGRDRPRRRRKEPRHRRHDRAGHRPAPAAGAARRDARRARRCGSWPARPA